jgi:hypothetical protein
MEQQLDAIAHPHAGGRERRGQTRGPVVQLGVRARSAAEHQRRPLGVGAAAAGQQLGQDQAAGTRESAAQVVRTVRALTPGAR